MHRPCVFDQFFNGFGGVLHRMQSDFLGGLDRLLVTSAIVKAAVVLVDDGVYEPPYLILVPFDLEEEHGPPNKKAAQGGFGLS